MIQSIAPLLPVWAWLLISILFYAVGEYISKTWANSPSTSELWAVIAASAMSAFFWLPALFTKNHLAIVGTTWIVLATITTIILGVVFFGEKLSALQWMGVALALTSLVILSYHS